MSDQQPPHLAERQLAERQLTAAQLQNEIVHRWRNRQSLRSIARDLGVSRERVANAVREHQRGQAPPAPDKPPASLGAVPARRASKLDRFEPQLRQLLERYPRLTAMRAFEELTRLGYDGGYSILRVRVKQLRGRPAVRPTVRFETAPGAQAQMDWSTYEIAFTQEGTRRVQLFSYLLGYSRRQYLRFTERQDFDATIRQHIEAFEHLGGPAALCLYDNMKVVVVRWEDGLPLYNPRFLAFATHYGFRPWACQVHRPQTKGKVERPFHYVETNLLNGREFRTLEHLNEVTRWWLAEVADRRLHGTTGKTPLELHEEERSHLLPLPALRFDTAQVVYRIVDSEGLIQFANNRYSVPWRLIGEQLPVRVTDERLLVYDRSLSLVAQHLLSPVALSEPRRDPSHAPPKDVGEQLATLRERYAELGPVASEFLEKVLQKQRYGKHDAQRILSLFQAYSRSDLLAAMSRAIQYHAYGYQSLERILAHLGTPKPAWQVLSDREREALARLTERDRVGPRRSADYQRLLELRPVEPLPQESSHVPSAPVPEAAEPSSPPERSHGGEPAGADSGTPADPRGASETGDA